MTKNNAFIQSSPLSSIRHFPFSVFWLNYLGTPNLLLQPVKDNLGKVGGSRDLRSVAQGGELVQSAVGDLGADLRTQDVEVAELGGNLRGRPVATDGDLVLVTDDEQSLGDNVAKVVGLGRGQDHVDDLALVLEELGALGAEVDVGEHGDPDGVGVVPLADVVDLLLVGLEGVKGLGGLGGDVVVDGDVGHALFDVVLEADGVDEDQAVDGAGVLQGEAGAEHAADGVADEGDVADAQRVEQAAGVPGQLVEAELVVVGLGALAPADLVRGDDAVSGAGEGDDGGVPGRAAEVLAVEQHRRLAVGGARGLDVHVGHLQLLLLAGEGEDVDGPGVGEVGAVEVEGERALGDGAVGSLLGEGQAGGREEARGESRQLHDGLWGEGEGEGRQTERESGWFLTWERSYSRRRLNAEKETKREGDKRPLKQAIASSEARGGLAIARGKRRRLKGSWNRTGLRRGLMRLDGFNPSW